MSGLILIDEWEFARIKGGGGVCGVSLYLVNGK